MRLPLTASLSTKDGLSNKNARLTNCLKEAKKGGEKAVVRPGLSITDTYTGIGNGLMPFDGRLLVVYGDTVTDVEEDSFPWPLDSDPWSAGTTYDSGDAVWYLGTMWFSQSSGNVGNTPGTGTSWRTSYETPVDPPWDSGTTYSIGDAVDYGGVTYYSMAPSNVGNNPSTSPQWSTTAPTVSRWKVNTKSIAALNATTPGPECASQAAAGSAWFTTATTFKSCATKVAGNWVTYVGIQDRGGFGVFTRVNQWTDPSPFDCSGSPLDMGIIDGGTIIQTV